MVSRNFCIGSKFLSRTNRDFYALGHASPQDAELQCSVMPGGSTDGVWVPIHDPLQAFGHDLNSQKSSLVRFIEKPPPSATRIR